MLQRYRRYQPTAASSVAASIIQMGTPIVAPKNAAFNVALAALPQTSAICAFLSNLINVAVYGILVK